MSDYLPMPANWRDELTEEQRAWLDDDMAANDANFYGEEDADE
jgi:hypothetical protein